MNPQNPTDMPPQRSSNRWVQVESSAHYNPVQYLKPFRMASIGYQFRYMAEHFPDARVLEIGVGSGLAAQMMRQCGHAVTTLDVDERLKPDLVASVTEIPLADGAMDAFVCSQVLEHLPLDQVPSALHELKRVCRRGGVISVPTCRRTLLLMCYSARRWGSRRWHYRPGRPQPIRWPDEHHWELEANFATKRFTQMLHDAGFAIELEHQPVECMYHQFFVLKTR